MPQLFLNNFQSQFIAAVKQTPESATPAAEVGYGVLRLSDGAAGTLLNPPAGSWYVVTAFKRNGSAESDYEVMHIVAVDNSVVGECRITVLRGQENTAPKTYAAGDILELRLTAGSMARHVQTSDPRLSDPRVPTGPAGGVLSGNFPNPVFAQAMATQATADAKVDKVPGKALSANDFTNADVAKLAGISEQATKNATDAQLRDRATHTGTQAVSTVAGLQAVLDSKAPLNSPTFTGEVLGVSKAMVGLGNVDNTSDASKPISTAGQAALDGKVDKVQGKGLSSSDFTQAEKQKLAEIPVPSAIGSQVVQAANAAAAREALGAGTSSFSGQFAALAAKPTTLGGYGITDALPSASPQMSGLTFINGAMKGRRIGQVGGAINCGDSNFFVLTLQGNLTFSFTNVPGDRYGFVVWIAHQSGTIGWPANAYWSGGVAPQLTTGKTHLFMFITQDGGGSWLGAALPNFG